MGGKFRKLIVGLSLASALLASCAQQAYPTNTPSENTPTYTQTSATRTPFQPETSTPSPTETSTYTPTIEPSQTNTPTPLPSSTPLPATPTETQTAGPESCQLTQVSVLMYHRVGDGYPAIYELTPEQFTAQMDWLVENGYRTLSLDELKGYLEKRFCPPGDRYVVLTFDDGFRSTYTQVYPTLRDRGLTGIAFLIGYQIRFTKEQIQEMESDGTLEFGSHLLTHSTGSTLRLEGISEETLKNEISTTNYILKDLTGKDNTSLAWPGGAYSGWGITLAAQYGIDMMFTTNIGPSSPGDSTYQIKRVGIFSYDTLDDFIQKVINGK